MSIDASRWARLADVQKSSNKAVLLELAHLVRYGAAAWTAFASIEYLARITHLNRKTVIDALSRLRALGVIKDTGRKAGANRSCPIYSLVPSAVPLIGEPNGSGGGALDMPTDAIGGELEQPGLPGMPPGLDQSPPSANAGSSPPTAPSPSTPTRQPSAHATSSGEIFSASKPAHTSPPPAGACAARLPPGWTLPVIWRDWTIQVRPRWTAQQIEAAAATFAAYWRSKGDTGTSEDWFETWRGWVFTQRDKPASLSGRPWDRSWSGIVAKGQELGLHQGPSESCPAFRQRVHEAVQRAASPPEVVHSPAQFRP